MECCNPGIVSEDWGAGRSRKRVAKILAEWLMSRREAIAAAAVAPKQCVSLEKFIGFELSFVPQVEQVYVDRADNGKEFTVTTVINERDPKIRAQMSEKKRLSMHTLTRNFLFTLRLAWITMPRKW